MFPGFPVFLAPSVRAPRAVEQFFHAAGGAGAGARKVVRASATITIFAETGAMLPTKI
jgi:hypothetical protein